MSGYFTSFMFFAVPVASIIFFVVSLVLFLKAKSANKKNPNAFNASRLTARKVMFIVSSALAFVVVSVVVSIIILLYMAVAYM